MAKRPAGSKKTWLRAPPKKRPTPRPLSHQEALALQIAHIILWVLHFVFAVSFAFSTVFIAIWHQRHATNTGQEWQRSLTQDRWIMVAIVLAVGSGVWWVFWGVQGVKWCVDKVLRMRIENARVGYGGYQDIDGEYLSRKERRTRENMSKGKREYMDRLMAQKRW
ncbi:hypothetical protein K504DRAFT_533297 [Pleomassaria siparia CBS 279.74]|uniref:Uncharacterized protein n=1 Tax=Pleomassaria siparia CBS 279.74 TaxID=1314801 RepID=A0A6G1KCZ3_9PLEO|nr:hypothetical protein K504DRAFT_533297 [Pleomassaria siparia CBS 279.74]